MITLTMAALALAMLVAWLYLRTTPAATKESAVESGAELLGFRRVLVVAAHPDDVEWYVGGTLRLLANLGAEVHVVVATDGEAGPNRIGVENLAATRREEQMAAAEVNGYSHVYLLGLPDRAARLGNRLADDLRTIWRDVRPDAVLTFDPEYPSLPYLHDDHQGVGSVVLRLRREESLSVPSPPVYLWQTRRPDVVVDISTVIDVKILALSKHATQGLSAGAERHRGFARRAGEMFDLEYAEAFRRVQ
jgi:LmbE family N-acetylglucosaminyl deacetylase